MLSTWERARLGRRKEAWQRGAEPGRETTWAVHMGNGGRCQHTGGHTGANICSEMASLAVSCLRLCNVEGKAGRSRVMSRGGFCVTWQERKKELLGNPSRRQLRVRIKSAIGTRPPSVAALGLRARRQAQQTAAAPRGQLPAARACAPLASWQHTPAAALRRCKSRGLA